MDTYFPFKICLRCNYVWKKKDYPQFVFRCNLQKASSREYITENSYRSLKNQLVEICQNYFRLRVMYAGTFLESDQSTRNFYGINKLGISIPECFCQSNILLNNNKRKYFRKFKVLPTTVRNKLFTKQKDVKKHKIGKWLKFPQSRGGNL